jgi:TIR domain
MANVFLSYARSDEAIARQLERAISSAGFSTFLDQHPAHGIIVGGDWLDELHRALARAGCLLFLSSAASAASPWCQAELLNAYWSGKLVIIIQLDDTDPPLNQRIQALRMTEPLTKDTVRIVDVLRRRFPLSSSSRQLTRTMNPYPGLRSFDETEAELFFGRWDLADEIVRRLTAPRASSEEFMLAISGPSGCGKSSLVRAGVLPLLRARHDGLVCVGPFEPSTSQDAIRAALHRSSRQAPQLETEPDDHTNHPAQFVLVLDQAERFFTETGGPHPREFVAELEQVAEQDVWFRCLIVFRSDLVASTVVDETFGRYLVRPIRVPIMQRNEMRQAIIEPATMAGIDFDDGLVEKILDETGGGQALPLLAYNLWNLAEMAESDRRISWRLYNQSGGVRATLREQADTAIAQLVQSGIAADQVLGALLRLVSITPGHPPSAKHVSAGVLNEIERQVMDAFVARKLIIKDDISGEAFYQPAHEELLRWPALSDYIERRRNDLVVLDGLEQRAELWAGGRRELLAGPDLAHARYFERCGLSSTGLKAFTEASRVSDRAPFVTRVTRPIVLFYGFYFLFAVFAYLGSLLFSRISLETGVLEPTTVGGVALYVLIVVEVLTYTLIVRRRFRFSRYGYYRIDGRKPDVRSYAARWLLFPLGIVLTPLSRSFDENRLTWADKKTGTELVAVNRDGSRRYDPRAPNI